MFADILEVPQAEPVEVEKRPTILIVDDDDALADVLSRRLRQQEFDTITANSGKAGLAKARGELPSLILLDLRLPDIDGFAICEQLADESTTSEIPVIILSGMEKPDILRQCRAAGCHYFVRKPYDPNALLILIHQAIRESRPWGDGPN
jgi:CheY-like chemotaxis protein